MDGVVAHGVRRSFGPVEAVRGIDLTARPGEVTALVGPNGAGKTTLLLVLATLLVPDSGTVSVAGFDPVTQADEVRARMGWAPDVFGLYDNLTSREYLEFCGRAMKLAHYETRAAELLVQARLVEKADLPVHTLSRGQKQRLGLMRALVHSPSVLLLDEPAAGLDPRSRVELRELLRLLATRGCAVIVSSHLLADLEELADTVVFVDQGVTVGEHRLDALPAPALRTWRVRALTTPPLLKALKGTDHDQPTAAGVDVRLPSDEAAADLLAMLVGKGVRVVSCQPVGGQLEATYLELTQ
ncbi:MAG: type transport system ATP-binding protein [Frankiales bacterium]|jgi:ABC-2 type transport system ATP-binding protein|nr:type transport system ATP-binding protein [Frankiales bacterium]